MKIPQLRIIIKTPCAFENHAQSMYHIQKRWFGFLWVRHPFFPGMKGMEFESYPAARRYLVEEIVRLTKNKKVDRVLYTLDARSIFKEVRRIREGRTIYEEN